MCGGLLGLWGDIMIGEFGVALIARVGLGGASRRCMLAVAGECAGHLRPRDWTAVHWHTALAAE